MLQYKQKYNKPILFLTSTILFYLAYILRDNPFHLLPILSLEISAIYFYLYKNIEAVVIISTTSLFLGGMLGIMDSFYKARDIGLNVIHQTFIETQTVILLFLFFFIFIPFNKFVNDIYKEKINLYKSIY